MSIKARLASADGVPQLPPGVKQLPLAPPPPIPPIIAAFFFDEGPFTPAPLWRIESEESEADKHHREAMERNGCWAG